MSHKDLFLKIAAEGDTLEPNAAKPRGGFQARMRVDHAPGTLLSPPQVMEVFIHRHSSVPLLPQNPQPSDFSNSEL